MTHRGRHHKKDRVLRYLELSFEGRHHHNNGTVPNQGLRPPDNEKIKSSQRQTVASTKVNDKPIDYQAQLDTDIQQLLAADDPDDTAPPGWANDITRQPTQSVESARTTHCSLAANKLEQQSAGYQYNRVANNKAAAGGSGQGKTRDTGSYLRPNAPHKYLPATDKRPQTAGSDVEHRLGRPTRTSLLRARQRCNSAPVTSYESRQEQQRRAKQEAEMKKQLSASTNQNLSDILSANIPAGESLHSFLIGARYNRLADLLPSVPSLTGLATWTKRVSRSMGSTCPVTPPVAHRIALLSKR